MFNKLLNWFFPKEIKGSWKWAVDQMKAGSVLLCGRTGSYYRISAGVIQFVSSDNYDTQWDPIDDQIERLLQFLDCDADWKIQIPFYTKMDI